MADTALITLDRHGLRPLGVQTNDENGNPVQRFEAKLLRTETLRHPRDNWSLDVDAKLLDAYSERGRQMLDAGMTIPIVDEHFATSAKHTMGYTKGMSVKDGWLTAKVDIVGKDAIAAAKRNFVSVEIEHDVKDTSGTEYGDAITRIALTPEPAVRGQDRDRIAASARALGRNVRVISLSTQEAPHMDILNKIAAAAGIASLTEDNAIEALTPIFNAAKDTDTLTATVATRDETIAGLQTQLAAKNPDDAKLEVDADIIEERADTISGELDVLVENGILAPVTRDKLAASLIGAAGKRNAFALSMKGARASGQSQPVARAVIDALKENKALPSSGEESGRQVIALSRNIPGTKDDTDPEMAERIKANAG